MPRVRVCLILLLGLSSCTWLGDVSQKFEARRQPMYFVFTSNRHYTPGSATKLPLELSPANKPIVPLAACQMDPVVVTNPGYKEELLGGTFFSNGVWLDLKTGEETNKRLRIFPLIKMLSESRYSYARFEFENLDLDVLDPTETSYRFFRARPNWRIEDYLAHFRKCPAAYNKGKLFVIHQILRGRFRIELRNALGLPEELDPDIILKMGKQGFVLSNDKRSFVPTRDWSIARSSRLRLNDLGIFTAPPSKSRGRFEDALW